MQFVLNHWELFAALAIIIALLVITSGNSTGFGGYQNTNPQNAVLLINKGALVVDIRAAEEANQGRLINSTNIPMAELPARLGELGKKKEKPVLLVSSDGRGAASSAKLLRANGFENIHNLNGGIRGWREAQLPLEKGG